MSLVSYEFIAFLAVLVLCYYLVPGRVQWVILLTASYVFYIWGGGVYALYPLATTLSTWFLAGKIGSLSRQSEEYIKEHKPNRKEKKRYTARIQKKQRRFMVLGLIFNFGILAVLKYGNVILNNVNGEFSHVSFILPLGISYYTFQSMGYLVDVYCQKYEPEKNLARFGLFVAFFPQLVSGPVSSYEQLGKELYVPHRFDKRHVKTGMERMIWGYLKKLVVADRLGPAVSMVISAPEVYDGIYVLFAMAGYVVWLYADFSGCMDIVLGAARMFGIRLCENFDRPFFSKSFGEFWRRWHMSLMKWLREYIFLPVSTSNFTRWISDRVSKRWGRGAGAKSRLYLSTIAVWLVSGIWHGASWEYVTWGMVNCTVLLASQELTGFYKRFHKRFAFSNTRGYEYFQVMRTILLFTFVEMFSYYPFKTVFAMLKSLVTASSVSQLWDGRFGTLGLNGADVGILIMGVLLMFFSDLLGRRGSIWERLERRPAAVQYAVVFGMFLLVLVTGVYGHGYDASQFLYNQF